MNHWMVEHFVFNHRTEKHRKLRNELHDRLIGHIDADEVRTELPKHGIARPSWFNPQLPTVGDVELLGHVARRGQK